jgi:hypothetical protein
MQRRNKTMLSDEEKKAIDLLKNIDKQKCVMLECPVVKNNIERQLKIIELNRTIRKQSKEIEELTLDLEEMTKSNNHKKENWVHKSILNSYVSKDKIKAKIEELEKQDRESRMSHNYLVIPVLQSLLEKE